MTSSPFPIPIPVCCPTVSDEDVMAVSSVMRSGWLSTGMIVKQFEEELCKITGYPHCVALSSCTSALFLALKAYHIGKEDDVVGVPALTFTATAAAVAHTGARVKFLDVDPDTWMLNKSDRSLDMTISVDLYGQLSEAVDEGADVLEDAAHAIGADFAGRAETICLSFYATKNITTMGEGGALLTRCKDVAEKVRCMSLHGLGEGAWARYATARAPVVKMLGYKANMTDAQAAMGIVQLTHLKEWKNRREYIAARYDDELGLPTPPRFTDGITHLYPVLLPEDRGRDDFRADLQKAGVGTGIHYRSLTDEPYWKTFGYFCPVAEYIGRNTVSLPLYPSLTNAQQDYIIKVVKDNL